MSRPDHYSSFEDLAAAEILGHDYSITDIRGARQDVLVLAPHGGGIEPGTSPLAKAIAGADYSLYLFEGLKAEGNGVLHVTSHRFSEPRCLEMLALAHTVVAIHGCSGDARICVGGLDEVLALSLTTALIGAGYPAIASGHEFPARHPINICNRGRRGIGVQLEISRDLRTPDHLDCIATSVREALAR